MIAELFKTLRGNMGKTLKSVFQKVVHVVGEVASGHNLGIEKESMREHLWKILGTIVNNAASTMFDDKFVEFLDCNFLHYRI
jgi:hypothetical protein